MKSWINKLALLTIFLGNLYVPVDLGFDFRVNYLLQALLIGVYAFSLKKIRVSPPVFFRGIAFIVLLALVPLVKGTSFSGFTKQFLLLLFQFTFAYLLVNAYGFDARKMARDYLQVVYLICGVAILQFISALAGFLPGADYSYLGFDMGNFKLHTARIQSWFQEPSFMVYALMPAVFLSLSRLFGIVERPRNLAALLILVVVLLARSSLGYLGLSLSLAIIVFSKYSVLRRPLYLAILFPVLIATALLIYRIPEVRFRVDDTIALFTAEKVSTEEIEQVNLSTYALYSNFSVMRAVLREDPVLGTGLGTYARNYDRFIEEVIPDSVWRRNFRLNREDGNSLLIRMLAETGIIGAIILLVFVFSNRLRYPQAGSDLFLWALNNGLFVLIALRILRQGHYTMLGFLVMLYLYRISYNQARRNEPNP